MILVTGATGFLGSELIRQLLLKGEKIRAIKRDTSKIPEILKEETSIEWHNADILDYFALKDAMEDISRVYHCAAMISFKPSDKKQMLKVNVEGTVNMLNLCMEFNIDKFLHVSSVASIGDSKKGALIREEDHWEFNSSQSAYSVSKYESEMEVFRAGAEGLKTVIINPSVIIGKNAGNEGSGKLFSALQKGLSYYPQGSFGYIDVNDVAKTMILLMESDIFDERFIISAENWTHKDLFTEISEQFGRKAPSFALKPWMLQLAYFGTQIVSGISGKNYSLTKDTVRSASKKRSYSNEKIKKALNLDFKPIRESIREICTAYNTHT